MLAKGHFERECKMKEAERKHRREDKRNSRWSESLVVWWSVWRYDNKKASIFSSGGNFDHSQKAFGLAFHNQARH